MLDNNNSVATCDCQRILHNMEYLHAVGFFYHAARQHKGGLYRTIKNPQAVRIDPKSGLAEASLFDCPFSFRSLVFIYSVA